MNEIDAILYLNLTHRADRNQHILSELHKVCDDPTKIHRVDAIMRRPGALGCGLSHIKALTEAQSHTEWKTIMIVEDDFTFRSSFEEINSSLKALLSFLGDRGCGLLSTNHHYFKGEPTSNRDVYKVLFSQTASGYVLRHSYLSTLLQNMKEAMYDMERYGWTENNCIDMHWSILQKKDNWYVVLPAIGYQCESYSDIEGHVVGYGC
jgi:GR25 family glycosyltransferase involved in LPS biosynthesis